MIQKEYLIEYLVELEFMATKFGKKNLSFTTNNK
jgi:hypothetical protein